VRRPEGIEDILLGRLFLGEGQPRRREERSAAKN
jgi:hypothetical protein